MKLCDDTMSNMPKAKIICQFINGTENKLIPRKKYPGIANKLLLVLLTFVF